MKKRTSCFTLFEFLFVVAVFVVAVGILMVLTVLTLRPVNKQNEFGRVIAEPTIGQIYMVTAADDDGAVVIAMPWKFGKDKAEMTDRRLLLKVNGIFKAGDWIIKGNDGKAIIIPSPIAKTGVTPSPE